MVLQLSTRTPVEYETHLTRFIRNETQRNSESILFLDCQSTLTRYLLSQTELKSLFHGISLIRTPTLTELSFVLKTLHLHQRLEGKRFLFISPFYHLLSDLSAWKQKAFLLQIENRLEKLEKKFPIHIVVAEE